MSQMVPSCGKRARNAYHGCSCADRRSRRSRPSRPVEGLMRKSGCTWFAVAAAWAILALAPVAEAATVAVRGVVQDGSKQPVAGATDATGAFTISGVADGKYFVYVEPTDRDHLPGGDLAKKAMAAGDLARKPLAIHLSSKIPH